MEPLNLKWINGSEKMGVKMVEWAKGFGKLLAEGKYTDFKGRPRKAPLTTSQIRKFYGEVMRIGADWEKYNDDVPMLNAKLAYAYGRKKEYGIEQFSKVFYDGINEASKSKENFKRLVKILEATVAYHKFHGGKEN